MQFRYVSYGDTKELTAQHPHLGDYFQFVPSGVEKSRDLSKDYVPSELEKNRHITSDFPVFCYILDGEKVASHFSSFPDRVYYRDNEYRWAWCGHLFTNPEYRGKGIASALVKEQVSLFHSKNLAWGGVFSTPAALRIYERLGFSVLGSAPRYLMIKTVRPLLKHHLANSFLTSAAEHAYGAFIHTARRMLLDDRAFFRAYDVDAVEPGTTDLNHALDQLKYSQSYHFDDSGAMMRWKIAARKIDQLHIARSKHTGNKAFYLLIRCREINERALLGRYKGVKLMTVMDYGRFDLDPSIPEGIISGLMALFFASDADICEIVSSDENICRCARRHGMMRVGAGMSFAYSVPADWKLGPQRGDIDQWHLTHYRGDAFGFE